MKIIVKNTVTTEKYVMGQDKIHILMQIVLDDLSHMISRTFSKILSKQKLLYRFFALL